MSSGIAIRRSEAPVASPCVGVCVLDEGQQVCIGCGRLIGEIAQWGAASEPRRVQIVEAAAQRLQALGGSPQSRKA